MAQKSYEVIEIGEPAPYSGYRDHKIRCLKCKTIFTVQAMKLNGFVCCPNCLITIYFEGP